APGANTGVEAIQVYDNTNSGSIVNASVANNTIIAMAPGALTYLIHAGSNSQYPASSAGVVDNNFLDSTAAIGPFYGGLTGFTYSDNINLVTGAQIPAP